ncbi:MULTISPECIES: helix-turn-helix transcriptional regulator [Bacteroidaceae]|jgi:DNA-binding XRE family transcriptional regulator|uniref:helix-turn-helix transcriptional regulator n=1 Tax=Bacteroidaceae TaxID=815 RepID=UPI001E38F621|nr:helix-turn-helix transcriptional regulator [Bacteroides ovatus]
MEADKMRDINRLKILLAEKKKTNKWLCEQLGVNPTTVSKWCTNSSQPSLEMVLKMMKVLDADINQIINLPERKQ